MLGAVVVVSGALLAPGWRAGPSARRAAMCAASVVTPSSDPAALDELHASVTRSGGRVSDCVCARPLDGYGMCLVAARAVSAGEELLSVPRRLHITAESARDSPLAAALEGTAAAQDDSACIALALLREIGLGEASEWCAYARALPAPSALHVPILWTDDERATLLRGSHLRESVDAAIGAIGEQWRGLDREALAAHIPPALLSEEWYRWAHAIVLSRALPFGDSESLIPLLDLANHAAGAPHTCSIGVGGDGGAGGDAREAWQMGTLKGEPTAVLSAGAPIGAGEQVFIDYGEAGWRSSWEMLYTYGFVPSPSGEASAAAWLENGGRPVWFDGVSEADPLYQQKRAVIVALGAEEGTEAGMWVDLKPSPTQAVAMAPLLRLALMCEQTEPELASELAAWKAEPKALWSRLQQPLSPAVEARVAERVVGACDAALGPLPDAAELRASAAPAELAESASAVRARLAARVLLGERHALEATRMHWAAGR